MQLNHQRDILTWQLVNPSGYHPKKKKKHPLIDYLKWLFVMIGNKFKQIICIHEWHKIHDKPIYDYWDYSGFHVGVFWCKCKLCGKLRKKKFY